MVGLLPPAGLRWGLCGLWLRILTMPLSIWGTITVRVGRKDEKERRARKGRGGEKRNGSSFKYRPLPTLSGTVTLWSPSVNTPLLKMLCHRGPLNDVAVERGGWAMVTVGMDARMKIWDIRSTYE